MKTWPTLAFAIVMTLSANAQEPRPASNVDELERKLDQAGRER